jgi:hypothetical protein
LCRTLLAIFGYLCFQRELDGGREVESQGDVEYTDITAKKRKNGDGSQLLSFTPIEDTSKQKNHINKNHQEIKHPVPHPRPIVPRT